MLPHGSRIFVCLEPQDGSRAQETGNYESTDVNSTRTTENVSSAPVRHLPPAFTFKTLAARTFMSMAEVAVPAKKMTLQVHNFDYEQND